VYSTQASKYWGVGFFVQSYTILSAKVGRDGITRAMIEPQGNYTRKEKPNTHQGSYK